MLIGIFFMCVATVCDGEGKPIYTYVTNKTDEIIYVQKTYSGVQIEDAFKKFIRTARFLLKPITFMNTIRRRILALSSFGFSKRELLTSILTMKSLKTNLWISGVPTAIMN